MIDTHCHLHSSDFEITVRDSIISDMKSKKTIAILVGVDLIDSHNAVALAQMHDILYATVGIHPHEAKAIRLESDELLTEKVEYIFEVDTQKKIVAIGECGLDAFYHNTMEDLGYQERLLRLHIAWAEKYDKPLVIHCRDAFDDMYRILSEYTDLTIIFHCFTGSKEWVNTYNTLSHTIYYSFSGIITFSKSEMIQEAVTMVDLDKILVETDSPFLTPVPYRGKQNTPLYLPYIVEKIAYLKDMSIQNMISTLDDNARTVFAV